jgi:FtsH-binding integral membrane protein
MEQDETTVVTPRAAGIRYGLIGAVVSIAWFLVMSVAGMNMQGPAQYVSWIVVIVLIVLAHKYFKDNGDGYMSYGQGIGIAFWYGLVSGVIGSIFTYIYVKFVDTTFMDNIRDQQLEAFEKQGMSDAQIEQAMQFSSMFTKPEMMLVMGLIGGIILSVVVGLIVTIFTQKKSPEMAI